MNFQLVRASDTEIAIWNTDHGHIFIYRVEPERHQLTPFFTKNIPDAEQDADSMRDAAFRFATQEAQSRQLLG